ncbi:MAG: zinc ribbon domain-containing protein [Pseudomonadota bacterium]
MPVYEYEHKEGACKLGKTFDAVQSIKDETLTVCPNCGQPVTKLISLASVSVQRSNAELRDLGFTKLVKRDNGVYENVTRRDGEARYMEQGKPETMPNLKKTIKD